MATKTIGSDTFTRGNQSGWGTSSGGDTWATNVGTPTLSIASNKGHATNISAQAAMQLGSTTSQNMEGLVRVQTSASTSTRMGVALRFTATNTFYHARLSASANNLVIGKVVTGTNTDLFTTAFTVSTATNYWIRFRVVGSNLYARAWADGSGEPGSWTLTGTDSSITGAGGFGLTINASSTSVTWDFDSFTVTDATTTVVFSLRAKIATQATKVFKARAKISTQVTKIFQMRTVLTNPVTKIFQLRSVIRTQATKIFKMRAVVFGGNTRIFKTRTVIRTQSTRSFQLRSAVRTQAAKVFKVRAKIRTQNTSTFQLRIFVKAPPLASGGIALFANVPAGQTAKFDSFRVTQYPDPSLLLSSAGRVGDTLVAWNASLPANTSLVIATNITGGASDWVNRSSGDAIAGIASQSIPIFDTFDADSSSSYTSTNRTGGSAGTWIYSVSNSRISVSGGTNAAFLHTATSKKDVDLLLDLDQAEQAGLVWRWQDASNFYELDIADASSGISPNTAKLYKVVSNVKTQLGSTAAIALARGTPHRIRVTSIGTALVVYLDGTSIISTTDSAITSAGKAGIFAGTGIGRFYNFRILALGDDLTGMYAYTRATLSSTDPTATPQLLDQTLAALSPDLGIGALIPDEDARNKKINETINDVSSASNHTWLIRPDKSLVARLRTADPAPWILTGNDIKIKDGPRVSRSGSDYCNRVIITNAIDTVSFTDRQTGDGSKRAWTLKYKLAEAPVAKRNGQAVTVAPKNTTVADYYYEIGSDTLTQDDNGTILESSIDYLDITGVGQTTTTVTRNNAGGFPGTTSQSDFAAITGGGSGIVTRVEDGSSMNVAQAQTFGDGLLQEFGKLGRTLQFTTERTGLKAGQYLAAIEPKLKLNDAAFLVVSVQVSYRLSATHTPIFQVEAAEGPSLGSWQKIIETALKK